MNIITGKKEIIKVIEKLNEATKLANEALANLEKFEKVAGEQELPNSDVDVVENSIPSEYNVKIGDIVEVTQYYGGYPAGTIGQVDTIDEDIEGYHNHVVVCGTDGDHWNECNVKLLYRPNRGHSNYTKKFR